MKTDEVLAMTHLEKFNWMRDYCVRNNLILTLVGEVGFGRECVGVIRNDNYPDYAWYEDGKHAPDVWTPEDAYHKHDCVAVLGRGEGAEAQLYEWLKWFDDNGYVVEEKPIAGTERAEMHFLQLMINKGVTLRMVKP